ncbi:hypothetical protein [Halobacterium bonnevillei]|uniref:CARDB domain-containing protein n=1 Tax=Halobacterium bonnevillei TaxID=2692200 RepID=A0A6B0SI11_9EURY|nr:hypothetical protein [Halobacterium bonnevillei]MXR19153.1 hypothetical protein [Halobacterium bonnevillei]
MDGYFRNRTSLLLLSLGIALASVAVLVTLSAGPVSGAATPADVQVSNQSATVQESGTISVNVSAGDGPIDAYVRVIQDGNSVASGSAGADGSISFDVSAGDYTVVAQSANSVRKNVSVSQGGSTPVSLTFATLEIDAEAGEGAIEPYANVYDTNGNRISGKTIPADDVATFHLAPGTYQAAASEANAVTKDVSLTAGTTTPVTMTFATVEVAADSGNGRIESYANIYDDGNRIDGKTIPKDGVATFHLDPGTYVAAAQQANAVTREISVSGGETRALTLTFATVEIAAEAGEGQIESYANIYENGNRIDGKTVPADGVATFHLAPGTYEGAVQEANAVTKDLSLTAGATQAETYTFGTLTVRAEVGNRQIESYSNIYDDGNRIDGKTVPKDGVATFHLRPDTYEAVATEANGISREVSVTAGETEPETMTFAQLNVEVDAGGGYANVYNTDGDRVDGKTVPGEGDAEFHLNPGPYDLKVNAEDSDATATGGFTLSASERTYATAQFNPENISVRTEALEDARFEFSELTPSATELSAGSSLSVSATVTNVGDTPGSYTAEFVINDEVVSTKSGSLGVDEQATVTFSTVLDEAGAYDVSISGLSAKTVAVTSNSESTTTTESATTTAQTTATTTETATPTTTTEVSGTTTAEAATTDANSATTAASGTTTAAEGTTNSQSTERTRTTEQDSDGDGVADSNDYAPDDPAVQDKSDVLGDGSDSETGGVPVPGFGAGITLVTVSIGAGIAALRD